jgi:hypothetical protein
MKIYFITNLMLLSFHVDLVKLKLFDFSRIENCIIFLREEV